MNRDSASPPPFADPNGLPSHGGDLSAAELRFGRPAEGWLDLSTGINPFPYPVPPVPAELWHRLPDPGAEHGLIAAACRCYGVDRPSQMVAGPGSQALIQWLPHLVPVSRVSIVGMTYGEHAAAWAAAGHQVEVRDNEQVDPGSRVVVVVNPNNPDGRRLDPDGLAALGTALARRGGLVVVDEAFADVAPELSLTERVGPGLVVLRSFGKFFGLAGLRLGFAVCAPPLAAELRRAVGPWAVSGPGVAVATQALSDDVWIMQMRRRLAAEALALDAVLAEAGLTVAGGTDLFRLVVQPRAWALYEHLGARGILVRPFAAAPRLLRFGLPGGTAARERLRRALAEWS
jgi:cobalamin biosynthetic protein CobC